ncbi:methylmalonyl-CoA mutase, C-terminal domain [Amycolatopsis xylanica]|uniref:Methylmalonyl-CoA mutase, C-terminal domain n=1 Tax=Amycolatopsis xylanica TaxID=589385 RepID=A0A1H3LRR8_9PSEU|nr:hypothetical protein [Amycolatopsis xylanica]SDY67026.1 methylmalonyl-CoA mutase, C-terminal domain [Amycolatopsis xylanica]
MIRVVLVEFGEPCVELARLLRDAGVEVVYTGELTTVDQIVRTAEQEDPDVLGVAVGAGRRLDGLAESIGAVRLFTIGSPEGAETRFETAEEAVKWVDSHR